MKGPTLSWDERLHYRDRFRAARYAALADSEGFSEMCFAMEALGLRLSEREGTLNSYCEKIKPLAQDSTVLSQLTTIFPTLFTTFDALYNTVKRARNDVMHTGVYARHATKAAIELCIGLEEGLMKEQQTRRKSVADFMVKEPVILQSWQPVAYARQLMLTHSFTYLPVYIGGWYLVSEIAMVQYLHHGENRQFLLAKSIEEAHREGLRLIPTDPVNSEDNVAELLAAAQNSDIPMLWLVADKHNGICGVITPYELM
ncbi:hypothetical protein [Janthinobacterium sp. RA13]|uniref:hypothetical protein n=1 Tax=Janthinobacterium sp. RA13 TaxID=1502762 RepID=UPI00126A0987|nr:hypothetical protein [Janthinobacterium sp. RA13]